MNNNTETSDRQLPTFNKMQTVKRMFYALRNGVLAAQMRAGGLNYQINFGLNLPQIKGVAADINNWQLPSMELLELANSLWANATTRESRLLAPMVFPADLMTHNLAIEWMRQAQTTEIADQLCHSLLRKLPFSAFLPGEILSTAEATDLNRYTALRLALNLLIGGKIATDDIEPFAIDERQRECRLTRGVTAQILEEIAFLKGEE